jgi:hypothetical protein
MGLTGPVRDAGLAPSRLGYRFRRGLAVAVIGMSIWFAPRWCSFGDQYGRIRAVITFVLLAAIAQLGEKRRAAARVLPLVVMVGVGPPVVSSMNRRVGH